MDELAETWSRSGKNPDDLYKGRHVAIIKELNQWLEDREGKNHANITLLWEFLDNNATIIDLTRQCGTTDDLRIAPFKVKHMKNVERVKVRSLRRFATANAKT